ncbi:MAG: hypothetical protein U0L26_01855 [Cellulosilyticum sp.]|nr:hypothetical protein [Cellulosilyticum sp.]
MAKANWAVVNPSSGSGNKTINVSSSAEHTGRSARSTVLTITAANVEAKTVNVTQQGKPEFTNNNSDTATAIKGGQNVTISGVSNSKKLTFSLGAGDLNITLPTSYTAGGVTTANGTAINGDPGATAQYNWSIVITVAENNTISSRSKQIIVTDEGGNTDTCVLTQAAGDAYLTVSKSSIELTYQGTAVSFNVESNTSWTIS